MEQHLLIILTELFSTIAEHSFFSAPLKVDIFSIFILKKSSETQSTKHQGKLHLTFIILTLTATTQKLSLKFTT